MASALALNVRERRGGVSTITITSSERGRDIDPSPFVDCCGLRPFVYHWPKKKLTAVMCSNKECDNHEGVLESDCDIEKKWTKFAKKIEA